MPEVSNPFKYPYTQNIIPGQTAAVNIKMPETVPNLPLSPSPSRPVSPASKQEAAEILAKPGASPVLSGKIRTFVHHMRTVFLPSIRRKKMRKTGKRPAASLFFPRPSYS